MQVIPCSGGSGRPGLASWVESEGEGEGGCAACVTPGLVGHAVCIAYLTSGRYMNGMPSELLLQESLRVNYIELPCRCWRT
jgi:hypothetical protein